MYSFQLETALAQSRAYLRLEFDRWCARWLVVTRSKTFDVHLVARTRRARAPARTRRGVKWKLARGWPGINRFSGTRSCDEGHGNPSFVCLGGLLHGPFYFVVGMGIAAKKMNDRS